MRIEVVKNLPPTIGHGALDKFHETKAVLFVRATDMRAQFRRFGKGLRPLGIVHIDFVPRGGKKDRDCIGARDLSPHIGHTASAVGEVADEVRQTAIEEASRVARAVSELYLHALATFLRESRQIGPRNERTGDDELFAYQHSRAFLVTHLARVGECLQQRTLTGSWPAGDYDPLRHDGVDGESADLRSGFR